MEKGRGSVRLKFWQKTYLLTLALFLLALGGGITAIASVSQQRAFEAECGKLLAQQHSVAQSLAADAAAVQARRPEALPRLAQNYAGQLKRSGVFLRVAQAGDVWADELPQPDSALPEVPPEGQRVHTVLLSGGRHVLYISAVLPAPPEDVAVTCAFDMEAFFVQWAQTRRAFLLAGAAVSAVLAAALYVVLRGLSRPMERLARVAGRLADGDYTARSPERTRDEVGQLAHALNEMAARVERNVAELRETARRKQQLVDNVAHELRTPLTAIKGWAETMQLGGVSDPKTMEKGMSVIVKESERLTGIVEELLDFSRLQNGIKMNCEVLDFVAEATDAALFVEARIRQEGMQLVYSEPPEPYPVWADPARLRQVFVNLFDNAIKYSEPGGTIFLTLSRTPVTVSASIRDQGRGIAPDDLEKVKQKFFKAKNSVRGSGIGLAVVDEIVGTLGGKFDIASTLGQGTTVTVTLPVYHPGQEIGRASCRERV